MTSPAVATAPTSATVPTPAGTATRPTQVQRRQLREILWSCPRLVAGGDLVIVYTPDRAGEASWLCAYARASDVPVRLAKVAATAHHVQRRARAYTGAQTTCVVLADMTVQLPPDAIQLAGTANVSAVDLWRSPGDLLEQAHALIRAMPALPAVPTAGARLSVRHREWTAGHGTVEAELDAADGSFVADGAVAVNRPVTWDARLSRRRVTLTVRDRVVTSVECPDPLLHMFLNRAVHTHGARLVGAVRIGVHPVACGFSAVAGPVNVSHPGVTLRLHVDASRVFSAASADLRLDLTANWEGGRLHDAGS